MTDIVNAAITNGNVNFQTNQNTKWSITFANNEGRKGRLLPLGNGNYLLQGERPYYFSASQVIYMTISGDQS